jgi:dipeptidase
MCDTLTVTPTASADQFALLAKNSDREPNEAHEIVLRPAADHAPGSRVRCTYIEIDQAPHTYAVALAKPFWIWGAEMGVNEHGVAIGNEAVFTKEPYAKTGGLLGMDLLRLALERGATAREALQVMIDLLEQHGQGGNCGFAHKLYYHNSFLIADPHEAWVWETAGRHWAATKVQGVYAISNAITLGGQFDLASPDLVGNAVRRGWCKDNHEYEFDFGRCYSDFLYTRFSASRSRCALNTRTLQGQAGRATPLSLMAALRQHDPDASTRWSPARALLGSTVCMHAGPGPARGSQTTGSLVAHLHPDRPTLFVTATAAPCTSIFKPLWLDTPLPDLTGPAPTGSYDPQTLFWRHERLHRAVLADYPARSAVLTAERDALEQEFVAGALAIANRPASERAEFVADCWARAGKAEARWLTQIDAIPSRRRNGLLYRRTWAGFDRAAGMPVA